MRMLDKLVKSLLTNDRLSRLGLRVETQEDIDRLDPVIEFLCEPAHRLTMPEPQPAIKNIPDWYKRVPKHMDDGPGSRDQFGAPAMTAKACLPLLDGMGLGYTLYSAGDITVRTDPDGKHMEVISGPAFGAASQHNAGQLGSAVPTYPTPALKFHNPWVIKTRRGYSTLFIPPLNALEETRFRCLGAVVDTDTYPKQVNFPALWFPRGQTVQIPAGTPLVTAIPFKRADVPREVLIRTMHEAERQAIMAMERVQGSRSHMYTHELREDRKTGKAPERLSSIEPGRCPVMHMAKGGEA